MVVATRAVVVAVAVAMAKSHTAWQPGLQSCRCQSRVQKDVDRSRNTLARHPASYRSYNWSMAPRNYPMAVGKEHQYIPTMY